MARENDVVDFRPAPDFLVMLSDHLQQIEGKPAKGEEENDDDHHFDHLALGAG